MSKQRRLRRPRQRHKGRSKNRAAGGNRRHTSLDNSGTGDLPEVRRKSLTGIPIEDTSDPRLEFHRGTNGNFKEEDELEEDE